MGIRRVLHCTRFFYLDTSNGAAVANRALMECLARLGFEAEAVCGTVVNAGGGQDPAEMLAGRNLAIEDDEGDARWTVGAAGVVAAEPPRLRLTVEGVPVTVHRRPARRGCRPNVSGGTVR